MKLRNKKTGEIVEFKTPACMVDEEYSYQYDSLAELNQEWEDVPEEEIWYLGEEIGNYTLPKEEARKITKKILAWERLKDKGFRFTGIIMDSFGQIGYLFPNAEDMFSNADTRKDIDLLFGGEK